jgi:hypothetical protein
MPSGGTPSFRPYSLTATAPEGAAKFGVRFIAPTTWSPGIHVDNVQATLSAVPEPASLSLLAAAGLLLARRKH